MLNQLTVRVRAGITCLTSWWRFGRRGC